MSIFGGFLGTIWTNDSLDIGTPTNLGVITRFNPVLDPGNLNIRGTGERGLYSVLLGFRQPRFTIEFMPTEEPPTWLESKQYGTSEEAYLFLRISDTEGLFFVNVAVNRFTLEARHGEAMRCTAEFWPRGDATYPAGFGNFKAAARYGHKPLVDWTATERGRKPHRWLDSKLYIGAGPGPTGAPIDDWWSWRYEVNNNLQRLGNVDTGGTRSLEAKQRDVTGLIVRDCLDFDEYSELAYLIPNAENDEFNITVKLGDADTVMLNCDYCRWGPLETPSGPEDLIANRFPFIATDLSTLTLPP